jgi:hypothetical protein
MATISVVPANQNNLLGPAASVPAALGVAPAGGQTLSAGNVLQPAASTIPAAQKVQTQPQITPINQPQQPASTPAQPAQTFSLGDGTTYDVNGNQVKPGGTSAPGGNQNQSIAAGAGSAGLSFTDLQNIAQANAALSPEEIGNIRSSLGIPATTQAAFAPLSEGTVQFYQDAYNQAGLGDLKSKIMDLASQINTANSQYTDAQGQITENPFLSEASRTQRAQQLYSTNQSRITNLVNEQNQMKDLYTQGLTEVNGLVTKYTNDFQTNRDQAVAKLNYLTSYAEKLATSTQNVKAQQVYRYMPDYLQAYGQTAASKTTIGSPSTGYFKYNPDTQTFEQVTPTGGTYTPFTTPEGNVVDFNTTTGAATPLGTTPASSGLSVTSSTTGGFSNPTQITIPQYPNGSDTTGAPQYAFQNNNPGNLTYAGQQGAVQGAGGFAKFASPQDGYNALIKQVQLDQSRGMTVGQYITKYAPPTSNNTAQYIQQASQALGVNANTPLASIDPSQVAAFQAMKESGTQVSASQGLQVSQPGTGSNLPPIVAKYLETLPNVPGSQYINSDRVADTQQSAVKSQAAGKVPVLSGTEVSGLKNIDVIFKALDNLSTLSTELLGGGVGGRIQGLTSNQAQAAMQTDPRFAQFQLARDTAIKTVQALAGGAGSGLRLNMGEIDTAASNLPNITDNIGFASEKIAGLKQLLTNQLNETLPGLITTPNQQSGNGVDLSDLNFSLQ